jgi:hypothetical protein
MIERYTIKFGPAVSQKELEKLLLMTSEPERQHPELHKMKARIEIVADFEDLKKVSELIKALSVRSSKD